MEPEEFQLKVSMITVPMLAGDVSPTVCLQRLFRLVAEVAGCGPAEARRQSFTRLHLWAKDHGRPTAAKVSVFAEGMTGALAAMCVKFHEVRDNARRLAF